MGWKEHLEGPPARGANRLRAVALPLCPARHGRSQNNIHRSRLGAPPGGRARWLLSHPRGASAPAPRARPPAPAPPSDPAGYLSPVPHPFAEVAEIRGDFPTGDPSGHLVRRKRCALGVTPAPNIGPKVPRAVCPRPLSRCVPKVPHVCQAPLGPELPLCARVYPNRVPQKPLSKVPQGFKNPSTVC